MLSESGGYLRAWHTPVCPPCRLPCRKANSMLLVLQKQLSLLALRGRVLQACRPPAPFPRLYL